MPAITTEHLRLTYGLSENNQGRQMQTYIEKGGHETPGTYVADFGNKVARAHGIDAYERGEGQITLECNCRKSPSCHHGIAALWHRALTAEGISAADWWEAEKVRRGDPKVIAARKAEEKLQRDRIRAAERAYQEQRDREWRAHYEARQAERREREREEMRIAEERRIEQARIAEEARRAEEERQRVEEERKSIREIADGPTHTTGVRFRFDPETATLEPLLHGRPFQRPTQRQLLDDAVYATSHLSRHRYQGYAYDNYGRPLERRYDDDEHPGVQTVRALLDTMKTRVGNKVDLEGPVGRLALDTAVAAGIAVLPDGRTLSAGEPIPSTIHWKVGPDGTQEARFDYDSTSGDLPMFDVDGLGAVDGTIVRRFDAGVAQGVFERMYDIGKVDPDKARLIRDVLGDRLPDAVLPRPITVERRRTTPRPRITLDQQKVEDAIVEGAKVAFDYDWGVAKPGTQTVPKPTLEGDTLVHHERDLEAEAAMLAQLDGAGESGRDTSRKKDVVLVFQGDETASLPFKRDILPALEDGGLWQVERTSRWDSDLVAWDPTHSFTLDLGDPIDEIMKAAISVGAEAMQEDVMHALVDLAGRIPEGAEDEEVERALDAIIVPSGHPLRRTSGGVLLVPADVLRPVLRSLWRFIHDMSVGADGAYVAKLSLSDLADLGDGIQLRSGTLVARLVELVRGLMDMPVTPVPSTFAADKYALDPVQQQGLDWMQAMHRAGFGGILADEVGVGKTLQILLHAASLLDQGKLTEKALVVVPKSAVPHWIEEIAEFFPGLKATTWEGPRRRENAERIEDADVVVTSYPCMNLDAEINARRWSLIGIDEAQDVRTPTNDWTQTLLRMEADQKIPTTGTPLENTLLDVWTLMQMANDGILGPLAHFRRTVQTAIEKNGDTDMQRRLARFLQPFMLHRTRKDAGHDIPDPVHVTRDIVVAGPQAQLYEMERLATKSEIQGIINAKGFKRGKGQILSALTRLRQICCHPLLVRKEYARAIGADQCSAKTDDAIATATRLKSEGKRILVFSQWTGHLDIMQEELGRVGVRCGRIDGTKSTGQRKSAEDAFKAGATDALLITLGTGGKTLNIREADAVFVMDPWWNPQKEIQGIGRTQRRGQTKIIEVYRFIVQNSIETRIVAIQNRKLKLAQSIFEFRPPDRQADFSEADVWDMLQPLDAALPT